MIEGIKVVDLSSVGPGARCSWILADLGADVCKVVAPASARRIDPPFHTYGAGRGTRREEINLKEDKARFLDLVAESDVVIESFRPGVADRLGVGYDACRDQNPKIVYAAITGYGQSGERSTWAGHDVNYLAVAGYLAMQNNALPGATVADSAGGGMQAAMSILAALLRCERTGEGAYLDVSTTNGVLFLMALQIDEYLATGRNVTTLSGGYACYDTYECGDGSWISVGAIEGQFFKNLCVALGMEELASAQYDDARQDELRAALRDAFKRKSRDEWVADLAPKDTCVAPVLSVAEVATQVETQDAGGFEQMVPVIARG
ncbi:MAG: CaiB/BaiF CoA-transferase family protein [Actinomycetota bacterium]